MHAARQRSGREGRSRLDHAVITKAHRARRDPSEAEYRHRCQSPDGARPERRRRDLKDGRTHLAHKGLVVPQTNFTSPSPAGSQVWAPRGCPLTRPNTESAARPAAKHDCAALARHLGLLMAHGRDPAQPPAFRDALKYTDAGRRALAVGGETPRASRTGRMPPSALRQVPPASWIRGPRRRSSATSYSPVSTTR